ncbi:MAG TPA: hypothetical protein VHD56_09410 [Tepidisphaeraceae bacterium]|nr:hypothetical protein [Tepidisphaeraceae bacterium]
MLFRRNELAAKYAEQGAKARNSLEAEIIFVNEGKIPQPTTRMTTRPTSMPMRPSPPPFIQQQK